MDVAAADPVQGKNLMYTFHFYPGTHREALRNKVQAAIDLGAAVFCSEWGTTNHTGGGNLFLAEAETWLAFMDRHQISWTNWSLCDKSESSAALISLNEALKQGKTALIERESLMVPETIGPEGYAVWGPDELSASGAFVRAKLRTRSAATSEPVRSAATSEPVKK